MPIPVAVAASAAPAAINFASSTAAGIGARRRQREQNEANMALAAQQAQWNLQQWERQNAYNTPAAQMQRYRDAGLNPNLIYGTGTASAGNADAVRGYDRANVDGVPQLSESLGQFQGIYGQQVRNDNIKAQTNVAHQDATMKSLQALGITYDNRKKAVQAGVSEATANYQVQAAELEVAEQQAKNLGLDLDNQQKKKRYPEEIKKLKAQTELVKAMKSSTERQDALRALQLQYSAKGMADQFYDFITKDPMLQSIWNEWMQMLDANPKY